MEKIGDFRFSMKNENQLDCLITDQKSTEADNYRILEEDHC